MWRCAPERAGAQLVVAGDLGRVGPLACDHGLDPVEVFRRRRLVDEDPPRAREDADARDHDRDRHAQRGDRVECRLPGDLDQGQPEEHADRRERVGAQVCGVAGERR